MCELAGGVVVVGFIVCLTGGEDAGRVARVQGGETGRKRGREREQSLKLKK